MMEETKVLNPFGYLYVRKVMHENKKPSEWWFYHLECNEVVAENEFYVLFDDGLLVKKGKSKLTTSQCIKGEKFQSFRKIYGSISRTSL